MCGRITLTMPDVQAVAALVEANLAPADAALYRPRYNAAPSDRHWIVRPAAQGRVLIPAFWGLSGAINARAESWAQRFPGTRPAIVPADGFYEWTGPKGGRRPLWFRPRAGGLLYLAALSQELPGGRMAFVVLTTDASGAVARIHDRMPVLLRRDDVSGWIERGDSGLLVPAPPDFLTATDASPRVNDVRNDDASLLDAPAPAGQLTLFG
ncbi:MAG TPA: SOS response-associated peptidase [Myxococcales bacterium]|nr:SOS response-associated peptidase [Myxococcales bacterium]